MFEEKQEYDVTIKASGHIEIRRSDIVLKDGVEIARSYIRNVVMPGDDVTKEDAKIQAIAKVVWPLDINAEKAETSTAALSQAASSV